MRILIMRDDQELADGLLRCRPQARPPTTCE
jgi:hypothetical protein